MVNLVIKLITNNKEKIFSISIKRYYNIYYIIILYN